MVMEIAFKYSPVIPSGEVCYQISRKGSILGSGDAQVSPSLLNSKCVRDSENIMRQAFNTAEAISVFNMPRLQAYHERLA